MRVIILLLLSFGVQADWSFENPRIIRNYDGDTFTAEFEIWRGHFVVTSVRVVGVDTPEIATAKCNYERELGVKAKRYVAEQLKKNVTVYVLDKNESRGRALGVVYIDGSPLHKMLINKGLGRENHGQKRGGWCE